MPGGVNSPVRAFKSVGGQPIVIDSVKGSHMWDIDGNEYIDYVGSWGPAIIGHADDKVLFSVLVIYYEFHLLLLTVLIQGSIHIVSVIVLENRTDLFLSFSHYIFPLSFVLHICNIVSLIPHTHFSQRSYIF